MRLLLVGAPHLQRVAEHLDAEHVVGPADGHAGLGELLGQDHLLERRQPGAAVLRRASRERDSRARTACAATPRTKRSRSSPVELAGALSSRQGGARRGTRAPSPGRPRPRRSRSAAWRKTTQGRAFRPGHALRAPTASPTARRATAAAPTSGPSRPSPAGSIRAPRAKLIRQRSSSSRCAAAKNSDAEAQRHRTGHHREAEVEQHTHVGHGAPDQPTGALAARPATPRPPAGPSRRRWTGPTPPPPGSRGHRRRRTDRRAPPRRGRRGRRCRSPPSQQAAVEDDAATHAGAHHHGHVARRRPCAAPHQPSPRASALASLSTNDGQPGELRQPGPQREVPPAGDVEGRDRLTAGRHRAAAPHADGDRAIPGRRRVGQHRPHQRLQPRPRIGTDGGSRLAARSTPPSSVDQPGRQLRPADVDREVAAADRATIDRLGGPVAEADRAAGLGAIYPSRA